MKPHITPDDTITIKKGFFFNYYKRIQKVKVLQNRADFTIHLNRTRQVSFCPSIHRMRLPVFVYGIYTNGCLFDYDKLSAGDRLKFEHFYPEIERWIVSFRELKKVRAKRSRNKKK